MRSAAVHGRDTPPAGLGPYEPGISVRSTGDSIALPVVPATGGLVLFLDYVPCYARHRAPAKRNGPWIAERGPFGRRGQRRRGKRMGFYPEILPGAVRRVRIRVCAVYRLDTPSSIVRSREALRVSRSPDRPVRPVRSPARPIGAILCLYIVAGRARYRIPAIRVGIRRIQVQGLSAGRPDGRRHCQRFHSVVRERSPGAGRRIRMRACSVFSGDSPPAVPVRAEIASICRRSGNSGAPAIIPRAALVVLYLQVISRRACYGTPGIRGRPGIIL